MPLLSWESRVVGLAASLEVLLLLHCALMAHESLIRTRFTYGGNGMVGSISETEDILDRILCFV